MLKTIEISAATKTRGIATTYRAGAGDQFGTCPKTCELNPSGGGSVEIDQIYFDALLSAVPNKGAAFTYCHFDYVDWSNKALPLSPRKTVVNYSAPSLYSAAESMRDGVAACVVVAPEYWAGGNSNNYGGINEGPSLIASDSIKVVRCPAEYISDRFSCDDCGGRDNKPLCARGDRSYIIGFTSHGTGKKAALDPDQQKGCYAAYHHVALAWKATSRIDTTETDSDKLTRFAASLRTGSVLRHHVAGDIGKQPIS